MANSDKNITITPNTGNTSDPKITFSGANSSVGAQTVNMYVYPSSNGTVSFESNTSQLLTVSSDMSNTLFAVNDISGMPSLGVNANGQVDIAKYGGLVRVGGPMKMAANTGLSPDDPAPSAYYLKQTHNYGATGMPGNGLYWIKPTNWNGPPLQTYCDFTTQGGGWTCIKSYIFQNRDLTGSAHLSGRRTSDNGFSFSRFFPPYEWMNKIKSGTYNSYLFYVSNSGAYDSHSLNNYAVVNPDTSGRDFMGTSGDAVYDIPGYGVVRGYTCTENPNSSGYRMRWWWHSDINYEIHFDTSSVGVPGSVSSEDSFGYYANYNTSHITNDQFLVVCIR